MPSQTFLLASYLGFGFFYSVRLVSQTIQRQAKLGPPRVIASAGILAVVIGTAFWPFILRNDRRDSI